MTAAARDVVDVCPSCRVMALGRRDLICPTCRARVPARLLGQLRDDAAAAKRREHGAMTRYNERCGLVIRAARQQHLAARQLALFPPNVGTATNRYAKTFD